MNMHRPPARWRRLHLVLLTALVIMGLAASSGTPALAGPKKDKLTAITAMPSKLSTLRRDANGKVMTQAERDAKPGADPSTPTLGNSDGMGTPADKTILESDQVLRETNTSGAGNTTTVSAYGMTSDMSAIDGTPTESPLNQRSVIDHQYPSVGGHFLDATHMGVLDFKQQVAGSDALFTLASPNQSAENWSASSTGATLNPGTTYEIIQGSVALTNSAVAKSKALHTQATSTRIAAGNPDPTQLWTVVDSGHGDGTFSLVNRSDGLCLARDGQEVTIDSCIDDPSRHWNQSFDSGTKQVQIFPVSSDTNSSLGSDGGQGVADTLGANTTQSWTAETLIAPGGSVPSWSVDQPNGFTKGNMATPYDMAAGDLDGVVTQDDQANGLAFHDEAAVAWTDTNHDLQLRVIDYNANASHLLVTGPTAGVASDITGGDVVVGIGDFDGSGSNKIVVGYQDASNNFTFDFYSYTRTSSGGRSLQKVSCTGCNGQQPFASTTLTSDETGYADLAVGDFDGNGSDDIALGFATWASKTNTTDHNANLGVWTLNKLDPTNPSADLTTRGVQVTAMPTGQGTLPRTLNDDGTRTQSGIRLAAGNFDYDPDNGFGPQRSELAIAYSLYNVSSGPPTSSTNYYKVEPMVNIYSVATGNCNSTLGTCDLTTTATNGKDPSPLFPSHPSQTTWRSKGTHFDPAPISLAAGGFGGQGTTDPPVEGLLASTFSEAGPDFETINWYQQDAIVVPWSATKKDSSDWAPTDTQTKIGSADAPPNDVVWRLEHYTAYDRQGLSLVLGAPAVMDIEQEVTPTVIAAEPPTEVDWLNSDWANVDATSLAYLQTESTTGQSFQSGTETDNTWGQTFNESAEAKASFGDYTYFGPSESGYVDGQQKFSRTWSGLDQKSTLANTSFTNDVTSQTNQDDSVSFSLDDSVIYRYPVLGAPGRVTGQNSCQQGCTRYYNVLVPKGSTNASNQAGRTIKGNWWQPSWSNMNVLSYPAVDAAAPQPIKPTDLGSYSYSDNNGTHTINAPLYDEAHTIANNSSAIGLNFSKASGSSETRTTSRTTDNSVGITASGTIGWGTVADGGDYASLQLTASLGYDKTNTIGTTNTGSNTTTSSQSFSLNYPIVPDDQSYGVATAYYYADDGSAKVVHGVDLSASATGSYWNTYYGQKPDPALNLPNRIGLTGPDGGPYDQPFWYTEPQRQLIRGFQVLQAKDDGSGLPTAGSPLSGNATAGQQLTFQVPVHNYSLVDMAAGTTLQWYAVPVDSTDSDDGVQGKPISLGSSTVPAIKAQGVAEIQAPVWTALASSTGTDQTYRIVAQLDPDGKAADMHPLAGTACPTDTLEPSKVRGTTPTLYDIMQGKPVADPLGCGQDNQGYGLVTVSPPDGVGADRYATIAHPARAQLAGGGLLDGNADHLKLTETSPVPTITAGQRITGIVRATASLQLNDHPAVFVYDGPVSDNKLIGVTYLNGIDDRTGGVATFDWSPDKPGLHELHEVLLNTKAGGQDDEQIMRVNVEKLDQYTVKAVASASSVPVGGAFSITGTIAPVPNSAFERTVQLQEKIGSAWKVVDSQQTSSSGRFDFDVAGATSGSHTYRVWKIATTGRAAAASAPVTVVVGGFVVTAKAASGSVDLGKPVTVTGTALPAQQASADRTVDLQLKSGSTWKTVATGTTTASGAYSLTAKPTKEGTYGYRVTKRATANLPAASSPTVSVKVVQQFVVTAKASPTSIKVGKKTTIAGKVSPPLAKAADRGIELQVRSGSTWKRVTRASTTASGSYSFSVKPTKKGTYSYRVVKLAAAGKRTAYSPSVVVKVTR